MHDANKNIDEYNPGKECKKLIVFGVMIPDIINNKKLQEIVIQLNISVVFITQS